MSGGHFDYNCFRISQFSEDLKHELKINNDRTKDEYGDPIGNGYDKDLVDKLRIAQKHIEKSAEIAREIEWLYSGDSSPESFLKTYNRIMKNG